MLEKIIDAKKIRLNRAKEVISLSNLKSQVRNCDQARDFRGALAEQGISIIAEIKRASPSLGDIAIGLDINQTAIDYEQAGADAISVITEQDYFKGCPEYIKIAKENTKIAVLRKDFLFEEYQIYESRFLGADALLLIAAILEKEQLADLVELTISLGMEPLVEVHNEDDIDKINGTSARVIGINNRDLNTFHTDLHVTENLISKIDNGKVVVSESGIKEAKDVMWLKKLGVNAILVGESIVRSDNFKNKIIDLKSVNY